jgi:hypothetical protein
MGNSLSELLKEMTSLFQGFNIRRLIQKLTDTTHSLRSATSMFDKIATIFEFLISCTSNKKTQKISIHTQLHPDCMHYRYQQTKMSNTRTTAFHRPLKIMHLNANGVLNDQYIQTNFLADHKIDIALMNETHLNPTNIWRIPVSTIYRTQGSRPPRRGTSTAVKSSIHHNQATLPQFAALEVTAINIPNRTGTLTIRAVYAPPSQPLLAQELTILKQCSQHFIFAGDYNAKHQM